MLHGFRFGLMTALVCLVMGCGEGGENGSSSGPDRSEEPALPAGFDLYVDAVTGSDSNPATRARPVRSITAALRLSNGAGEEVYVGPGLYDEASGEVFPIRLRDGIQLVGDEAGVDRPNAHRIIRGAGPDGVRNVESSVRIPFPTVILEGFEERVTGFVIENPRPIADGELPVGVALTGRRGTVSSTSVTGVQGIGVATSADSLDSNLSDLFVAGNEIGIDINDAFPTNTRIQQSTIVENFGIGVRFSGAGDGTRLTANEILRNGVGIALVDDGDPNAGGLPQLSVESSADRNQIGCSFVTDLFVGGDFDLSIAGNSWDRIPPRISDAIDGTADIVVDRGGAVDVSGATVQINCDE